MSDASLKWQQWLLLPFLFCLALPASALTVIVRDAKGQPVTDAVVTLMPAAGAPAAAPVAATIEQINKAFSPLVSVIPVGTKVLFPNRDRIRHHVYSFSPAKTFDIKLYAGDPPPPVQFDKPGIVVLGCNIHDWMIAYVVVTDAPYYGKTDAAGRLVLAELPAADYEARLWHAQQVASVSVKKVRLTPGQRELALEISLNAAGVR
ncbi:MAG: methylamine utilization protein [Moraxellaceae bacterium]|nr:methylamine utilization protein [Moraxellaceae bacterium]